MPYPRLLALAGLGLCLLWNSAIALAQSGSRPSISPPQFSHEGGFQPNTFMLRLSHPDPGSMILYTLDGSEPVPAIPHEKDFVYKNLYQRLPHSQDGPLVHDKLQTRIYRRPIKMARAMVGTGRYANISTTYQDRPITHLAPHDPDQPLSRRWARLRDEFSDYVLTRAHDWGLRATPPPAHPRGGNGLLDVAVVVRAMAVGPTGERSPVVTRTFFFGQPQRFPLPVLALTIDPVDAFGYERGILVAGRRFDAWRSKNRRDPASLVYSDANWLDRGDSSERPAHAELFDPLTGQINSAGQGVGVRVHGAFSRAAPNKSLRLYARNRYGSDDLLLFGDFGRGFPPKQVIVRNAGNDRIGALFRDAALHHVMDGMHMQISRAKPVIVFLNGEYWGLYNVRERLSDNFFARAMDTKASNIEVLENFSMYEDERSASWEETMNAIRSAAHRGASVYDTASGLIDLDNYIDAQIAYIYAGNSDWPHNNVLVWRRKQDPMGDTKWRWILQDFDRAFESPRHPTLTGALAKLGPLDRPDLAWSTELFRLLMGDRRFRAAFIRRYTDLLNFHFTPERVIGIVDQYAQHIASEVPTHIARWQSHDSLDAWHHSVESLRHFARTRPALALNELRDVLSLPAPVTVTVPAVPKEAGHLEINGFTLSGDHDSARPLQSFPGTSLRLVAKAAPCHRFAGWKGLQATKPVHDLVVGRTPMVMEPVFERECH